MSRHGQRGELARKINAQISEAQYDLLARAAEEKRVNISTILRWLIDDHASDYIGSQSEVGKEGSDV